MTVAERVRKALDIKRLSLPESPHVLRIVAEDYANAAGDDALRIVVVLANDTDMSRLSGDDVLSLKSAIRESLQSKGVALFPYIFFATEDELKERESGEEG
ncbi:MAG: hypothetical protein HYX69_21935 [Planctomycetia bacterium]|nr:hypothetical protein [Planctomycetia bacterium]